MISDNDEVIRYTTERLELIACTLEMLEAEIESHEKLSKLLDVEITSEWPPGEYDSDAREFFRIKMSEGGREALGWFNWYAACKADGQSGRILAAAGGFIGPPSESGEIEIGFSVIPSLRNQGYATEMAGALVAIASRDKHLVSIIARTHIDNAASGAVLRKVGFIDTGLTDAEKNIIFKLSIQNNC